MKRLMLILLLLATPAYSIATPNFDTTKLRCRTKLVGWKDKSAMSPYDLETLETARKECPKRKPDKPCVVEFQLKGFQDYHVICGFPRPI